VISERFITAQIADEFIYKGQVYKLVGIEGDGLAEPQQFGMQPEMIHSA
jgi:hypothetical protein